MDGPWHFGRQGNGGSSCHLIGQPLQLGHLPGALLGEVGAEAPDVQRAVHAAHGQQAGVGGVEGQTRGGHAPGALPDGGRRPHGRPAQVEDLHHAWGAQEGDVA